MDDCKNTTKQVIVMRKDLGMRKGKMVAQGAHASTVWLVASLRSGRSDYLTEAERNWTDGLFTKICVGVTSEEELLRVHQAALDAGLVSHLITDAGLTEFSGVPTKTCCAIGPDWTNRIDPICGDLSLL